MKLHFHDDLFYDSSQFNVALEKIAMPIKIHVHADVKNGAGNDVFCIEFILVVKS